MSVKGSKALVDQLDGHKYRLLQLTAMKKLFRAAHNREPESERELADWLDSNTPPGPIDPLSVLDDQEVARFVSAQTN